jgi:ribosomal protein S18 acetylase RimI-like enzyme
MTIRTATLHDLDAVASLFDAYRQFYAQAPDLVVATAFIRERMQASESVILLASNDKNEAVGFCQLYPSFCSVEAKPIYVLYDLFVAPQARRGGAGTALLRAAEATAHAKGKARMDLTTAKTNLGAQAAYEALGWVRDEVFLSYSKRVN